MKPKVYSQGNNKDGRMTFYRAQLGNLEWAHFQVQDEVPPDFLATPWFFTLLASVTWICGYFLTEYLMHYL